VRGEKKGKEIYWEIVVREHTSYKLKNAYSHDLLWISALLYFIV